MIVVLGEKELEEKKISLRDRRDKQQSLWEYDNFIKIMKEKMREVSF